MNPPEPSNAPPKIHTVRELVPDSGPVIVEGRILSAHRPGGTTDFWIGTFADQTGPISYSSFSAQPPEPGTAVRIEGAHPRLYKGLLEIHVPRDARWTPAANVPPVEALPTHRPVALGELERAGRGERAVMVQGRIAGVRPRSGLVQRCRECRRVVADGECSRHGRVETYADLRAKLVVDDGSGVANVIVDRPTTERLLGITLDDVLRQPELAPALEAKLRDSLFWRRVEVRGDALKGEYGTTILAQHVQFSPADSSATIDVAPQDAEQSGWSDRIHHRVTCFELANAQAFERGDEGRAHVLRTPSDVPVSRVVLVGTASEARIAAEGDVGALWVATLHDGTGEVEIRAGGYDPPEAREALARLADPTKIVLVGKVDAWVGSDDRLHPRVRILELRELHSEEYKELVEEALDAASQRLNQSSASDDVAEALRASIQEATRLLNGAEDTIRVRSAPEAGTPAHETSP